MLKSDNQIVRIIYRMRMPFLNIDELAIPHLKGIAFAAGRFGSGGSQRRSSSLHRRSPAEAFRHLQPA